MMVKRFHLPQSEGYHYFVADGFACMHEKQ
jgi:hypothetical protein